MELLDTMDEICSETSRLQWQQQLSVVYRKRSVDLKNPNSYDAKQMDEFLQTTFISAPSMPSCRATHLFSPISP